MSTKEHLTEKLLYILADLADYNSRLKSYAGALSLPDDPRFMKHRLWLDRMLENKRQKQKVKEALYNLKRGKFLQEKVFENSTGYFLTSKGSLKAYRIKAKKIKKAKLPAGQYLMVFFDIPESERKLRDNFRFYLKELGFEKMQKSVWVTSYGVVNELKKVIKDCELENYAKPLLVQELL